MPSIMGTKGRDNVVTTAAMGALAYLSADIGHHALGHAAACLALGGSVVSLSSVVVSCSTPGRVFAIAGPMANLVFGLLALLVARSTTRVFSATGRMFWTLVAGFNLLWFAGQLVFSVAARVDDWEWAMRPLHIGESARFGMIALGAIAYIFAIWVVASELAPYARPPARARRIVFIAWLAAGMTACAVAAFDHHAAAALRRALPQSLALPIGLLLVPRRAAERELSGEPAPLLPLSVPWIVAAGVVGVLSILLLGPGVAIAL